MYQALECCTQDAIGHGGSWAALMDSGLVNNLGEAHSVTLGGFVDLAKLMGSINAGMCNIAEQSCSVAEPLNIQPACVWPMRRQVSQVQLHQPA